LQLADEAVGGEAAPEEDLNLEAVGVGSVRQKRVGERDRVLIDTRDSREPEVDAPARGQVSQVEVTIELVLRLHADPGPDAGIQYSAVSERSQPQEFFSEAASR
jgi:hypothetical protein